MNLCRRCQLLNLSLSRSSCTHDESLTEEDYRYLVIRLLCTGQASFFPSDPQTNLLNTCTGRDTNSQILLWKCYISEWNPDVFSFEASSSFPIHVRFQICLVHPSCLSLCCFDVLVTPPSCFLPPILFSTPPFYSVFSSLLFVFFSNPVPTWAHLQDLFHCSPIT